MPPHPTDACYCHVVEAGARNIQRLAEAGDLKQIAIEAEHLAFVAKLVTDLLLHCVHGRGFDEAEHAEYWTKVRRAYAALADPGSLEEMDIPWEFLASSLRYEYPR
jgi:hypothetical protein